MFSIKKIHNALLITLPLPKMPKGSGGRRLIKAWALAFLLGIFFAGIFIILLLAYIFLPAFRLKNLFTEQKKEQILSELKTGNTAPAKDLINELKLGVRAIKNNLAQTKFLQNIPLLGPHLRYAESMVHIGENAIRQGEESLDALEYILRPLKEGGAPDSPETRKKIFQNTEGEIPHILDIQSAVSLLSGDIRGVPVKRMIPQIKKFHQNIIQYSEKINTSLRQAAQLVQFAPILFGFPDPHRTLILLQNNSELRPTGGFIGSYALLTLELGKVREFTLEDVYALDTGAKNKLFISPPWPLEYFNNTRQWFLRDSNWSPHFPEAAEKALWFFQKEGGQGRINSVIAITPEVMKDFLELLGPVKIEEKTISSENIVDFIENEAGRNFKFSGMDDSERKKIILILAQKIREKALWRKNDFSFYAGIASLLLDNLEEKHILLYSHNLILQENFIARNWAGEVKKSSGDFLMLIDASLGSLKTDPWVQRSIQYTLSLQNNSGEDCDIYEAQCKLIAQAKISYTNTAGLGWKTTRYQTFQRLYVPRGSKLLKAEGAQKNISVGDELGKTVFGTFFIIEPKSAGSISYTYILPPEVKEYTQRAEYQLSLQKQPGTKDVLFRGLFPFQNNFSETKILLNTDSLIRFPLPIKK